MTTPKKHPSAGQYIHDRLAKEHPPQNKLFDKADSDAKMIEAERFAALKRYIEKHGTPKPDPILGPFQPFLLIRSQTGDHGGRPLSIPTTSTPTEFFETTPDIWAVQGDPTQTPAIPPGPGGPNLHVRSQYTFYAHVWNLGRAPVGGVHVEFWVFEDHVPTNPALDPTKAQRLGMVRVDLAPRASPACHRLVKGPAAWTIPSRGGGGITASTPQPVAVVQVSGLGDSIAAAWDPLLDRHVARRDFTYFGLR